MLISLHEFPKNPGQMRDRDDSSVGRPLGSAASPFPRDAVLSRSLSHHSVTSCTSEESAQDRICWSNGCVTYSTDLPSILVKFKYITFEDTRVAATLYGC